MLSAEQDVRIEDKEWEEKQDEESGSMLMGSVSAFEQSLALFCVDVKACLLVTEKGVSFSFSHYLGALEKKWHFLSAARPALVRI